ncbi:nucleotidyltransferase domain-containing protein [Algoriphagus sp. D3-2-R+10]|uniref:nucleotidyltransferase family protein n=1 Tax=Algoriphagus aurantiacus TaxID=3103948 RepID=UPI002B3B02CC|nr:nucleotidyltransferase domain-containing protein [Algoriphagus sp. D3-2-R+10]MEB2777551.1 nucleotidyltransferase domain-containing protein [Algoriphagus sp. D3-2-R+10]
MEEKALLDQVSDSAMPLYVSSKGLNMLIGRKDAIIQLCEKYELEKLYVFGSVVENKFNDESDFDFLIQFKNIPFDTYTDHYFSLHEDLQNLLGREIDLLTDNSLTNKFFKDKVYKSRLLLYAA